MRSIKKIDFTRFCNLWDLYDRNKIDLTDNIYATDGKYATDEVNVTLGPYPIDNSFGKFYGNSIQNSECFT